MAIEPSKTVIRDVSNSLRMLLANSIPDLAEENISFDSPADFTPPSVKSLSQFLFQVKIDPFMRNQSKRPAELEGGSSSLSDFRDPPVIVDLIYMLTPFGPDTIAEMELVEQIIGTLSDNSVLTGELLDGTLDEQGNRSIRIVQTEFGMEIINNIWSIFPNKNYKLSLFYTLGPVKIMSGNVYEEKRVVSKKLDLYKIKP